MAHLNIYKLARMVAFASFSAQVQIAVVREFIRNCRAPLCAARTTKPQKLNRYEAGGELPKWTSDV